MACLLALLVSAQEATIADLIHKLGFEEFEVRDAAGRELRKRGMTAVSQLKDASRSNDAEIVARSRSVLGEILEEFGLASLQSFEDAMENSPGLRVKSQTITEKKDLTAPFSVEGDLLRKPGGKIRANSLFQIGEETWSGFLVSDGERMMLKTRSPNKGQADWGLEGRDSWPMAKATVARVGAVLSASFWWYARDERRTLKEMIHLHAWRFEEESASTQPSLEYRLSWIGKGPPPAPVPSQARVWYDPATFRPTKRILTYSATGEQPSVLETFSYPGDIAGAEFNVPEGRTK